MVANFLNIIGAKPVKHLHWLAATDIYTHIIWRIKEPLQWIFRIALALLLIYASRPHV